MSKNNAKILDLETYFAAGINPKTGLPIKFEEDPDYSLKCEIRKSLRILDEQNAINRYKWYNLPSGLTGQLIERILYYKAQGAFFRMSTDKNFYFLPYALAGSIDVYGRFKAITPLPFNGTSQDKEEKAWITGLTKYPVYEVQQEDDLSNYEDGCVLLSDYSKQISQTNISRSILQDPILTTMAECIPFMRTALISGTGIKGMKVETEDDYSNVEAAAKSIKKAALTGKPWIPFVAKVDFQDMTEKAVSKSEEYLLAMQSLDNLRLSLYGLSNGGLFQKKSHMLEAEQEMNSNNVGLVMQDGLTLRQEFCDIVNSIWDLGIWVECSETITESDTNNDGILEDTQDQSGFKPGSQKEEDVLDDIQ